MSFVADDLSLEYVRAVALGFVDAPPAPALADCLGGIRYRLTR